MPGPTSNTPVPDRLGKYEVRGEIARGSMGIVFYGHDPYIDRPVALKIAFADSLRDKETGERYRKMFFNEAHTAGMLRHPNILDVFDAGIEDGICYIVMELVAGADTLKRYTKPETLLSINKVVEIVFKCAKALDYAHRQGVIHRDIKPSNILLTEDGDVKIADFSIAHITRPDASSTMPMGFVGSPRYMSPEQVQEDQITTQTDLFSLGIVLYELLTGHHPFGGEGFSALIHRIINEDPIPMETFRQGVPPALARIAYKALEKDPERRYRMGLDMAVDLAAAFHFLDRPQEDLSLKEKFTYVKQLNFFSGFPDSEVWEIIRASLWQEYGDGDEIITEGDIDDSFYIITDGTVRVRKGGAAINELRRGDCFGEMGYLSKTTRTASILAKGRVSLMKINATLMEKVSKDCQLRFCKVFLRVLIERLSLTTQLAARSA
ncbi:MAG: protein kinase [Gammaproteobacteria bacterium]